MKRIVLISPTPIKEKMTGPSIRYWEIASQLARQFDVVLLCPNRDYYQSNLFKVDQLNLYNVKKYCNLADVLVMQGTTLWKYPLLKYINVPKAIDLYDPFHLENLELFVNRKLAEPLYRGTLNVITEQLLCGDYFFCASEKQKDYWLGMLTALGRIDLKSYKKDKTFEKLIGIVPFGIDSNNPRKTKNVMKGVHPHIKKDDYVVLWGGGIWDWLDPETLLNAMAILREQRNDIKCFFMGVKPPNGAIPGKLDLLKDLSVRLGLEETVIFNDWVDYNERSEYLLEADVGISLHNNHLETRYSFRTRILDYIWCNLPIVSSEGDVLSDLVDKKNLGVTVPVGDAYSVSQAILELKDRKMNFDHVKSEFLWEKVIEDLKEFCEMPCIHRHKFNFAQESVFMLKRLTYYFFRFLNKNID